MKTILFSNQEAKVMTFEETMEAFTPTIQATAYKANSKFIYNAVEHEEMVQMLNIELWNAYKDYDHTQGNCFSTYLHYKLKKGVRDATYWKYAQKNQGTVISSDAKMGDSDLKLEDLLSVEDTATNGIEERELVGIIKDNMNDGEHELLQIILNVQENPVIDYANKYGITRQAATQRVNKLKRKLRQAISSQYLGV